jgi:hypothetical protein
MSTASQIDDVTSPGNSRLQRLAPIFTLIVCAPGIAEVLSGATRLSYIFVLIPEMMVWGCGALLIREIVRHWQGGWTSLFLLGLALSVAEEFVIQQTSLAPLPWVSSPAYGRIWGVNLIFFLFMLGYESVFVVLVPVQLTELIFPHRRNQPWLKKFGLIISSIVFVLGSFIAWFAWTQNARPNVFHVPKYQPPFLAILSGVLLIALLTLAAYALRNVGRPPRSHQSSGASRPQPKSPSPWIVGLIALVFGFPWYLLMSLIFGPRRDIPIWIPVVLGILWATMVYFAIHRRASSPNWNDMHRWALIFAATIVCMLAGFGGSSAWPRMDIVAKAVLNVLALAGFINLALKIRARSRDHSLGTHGLANSEE